MSNELCIFHHVPVEILFPGSNCTAYQNEKDVYTAQLDLVTPNQRFVFLTSVSLTQIELLIQILLQSVHV